MITIVTTIFRKSIVTIYYWFWVVVGNILGLAIIVPGRLLGASERWARRMITLLIAELPVGMMRITGFWKVEYIDNRTSNIRGPYIIVSNHISLVDTAFTAMLPLDIIYTWKKKWSYTPGFGWLCLMAGHITIDPKSDESKRNAIIQSEKHIKSGNNVLFYPEGTRNKDPKSLLPFKTGAFRVAKAGNVKIIPVTLVGTYDGCKQGICDYATIKVIIDNPVAISDVSEGVNLVRDIILNNLKVN